MEKDNNGNKIYKDTSIPYKSTTIFDYDGFEHQTMKIRSERMPMCGDICCYRGDYEKITNELINNGHINHAI